MTSVTKSSSAASPELHGCHQGLQPLPRTSSFPFGLRNLKVELPVCFSGCSRTETRGVVTTSVKVVPGSTAVTCSTLTMPSFAEGHKTFATNTSLQRFTLNLQPGTRSLIVVLSLQEQGLHDVEKLMRRPKAKAEERLREVLEEFVAGCRLACP